MVDFKERQGLVNSNFPKSMKPLKSIGFRYNQNLSILKIDSPNLRAQYAYGKESNQ